MNEQVVVAGTLHTNSSEIPYEICGNTRYSFQIRLLDKTNQDEPFVAESFLLRLAKGVIEMGRCQVFPVGRNSREFIVFPMDEIVDIVDLLGNQRYTIYDRGLFNMLLILNQKERVTHRFKEFSSNLLFEINVYKKFFDDLDRQFVREPGPVQAHLQTMILSREGKSFIDFFEAKVLELEEETKEFTRTEDETHGFYFRKLVWDCILQSAFMMRTNLKPRGYAGDYEMMKMLYENEQVGYTMFSRLLHTYPLSRPAADAVRNRKRIIADHLGAAIDRHGHTPFRAMSVACGPAAEIGEVLSGMKNIRDIHFTLLDQDSEALKAAGNSIRQVEIERDWQIDVSYINDSVRSMLKVRGLAKEWGHYDFVYSMGLFDYLTPPVARAVLSRLSGLLRPGGRLLIGNFHTSNPDRTFMEYWLDWVLYHRSEEEMLDLATTLPGKSRVFFDETGCQMFLEVVFPNG